MSCVQLQFSSFHFLHLFRSSSFNRFAPQIRAVNLPSVFYVLLHVSTSTSVSHVDAIRSLRDSSCKLTIRKIYRTGGSKYFYEKEQFPREKAILPLVYHLAYLIMDTFIAAAIYLRQFKIRISCIERKMFDTCNCNHMEK